MIYLIVKVTYKNGNVRMLDIDWNNWTNVIKQGIERASDIRSYQIQEMY